MPKQEKANKKLGAEKRSVIWKVHLGGGDKKNQGWKNYDQKRKSAPNGIKHAEMPPTP